MNTIQAANRMPMMIDGADMIFTGHAHEAWTAEKVRMRLDRQVRPVRSTLKSIQGATYKDEYKEGGGGWHVEGGKPAKPLGAWWLRFFW